MNFTTTVPLQKSNFPINYNSKIVSLGSCFAENMAEKFEYFKFHSDVNPFGIIFNPVSIEKLIHRAVHKIEFTEDDVFFHNELWHCFEVHSDLNDFSNELLLTHLNRLLHQFRIQLEEASHIIITLGTSWVYRNKISNQIVANCHKVPQSQFGKELLSIETIQQSIQNSVELIQSINSNCAFVFTISPVRHIKDGFVENQRSKSHLITALQSLLSAFCLLRSEYFPSYEIMMDELRDYRFYANDMLHPSPSAIDYIWIKFFEHHISETEFALMNQVCEIQRSLKHRPFNPNSESHQKFLSNLNQKIQKLQEQLPHIHFS
ncbi:GSCFA domain-containing protein [Flavobacterium sp.]|uniref:GSCFA domain-containing protein n=1 Tax=Flavobacterium sp. TaxID=239 RepID=UPI002B4AEED5|nr:GSCFA domain-containing protein [Flavobacterium sp.]HLP65589.1 GSCFA domain-containing protein [Flavobacterium sp.]